MKSSLFALTAALMITAGAKANVGSSYYNILSGYSIYELRNSLQTAYDHGLQQENYWSANLERQYSSNPFSQALKDTAVNNYLKMLKDIHTGIVNPSLVGTDIKFTKKAFISAVELQNRLNGNYGDLSRTADTLAPTGAEYQALRSAHRNLHQSCRNGVWRSIPSFNGTLKLGSVNSVVYDIKGKLMLLGYDIDDHSSTLDANTVKAINDIQWSMGITPDGKISSGGKTHQYLNVDCHKRLTQIRQDMEKLRWLPQHLESRHIFVNIAMAYMNVVDRTTGYNQYMNFTTITGRAARKTPTMRDRIVNVAINPFWVVPPTIFREDKVEDLRGLSPSGIVNYFDRSNYEVMNKNLTQRLDPASIDWANLDAKSANFYIRQKPHSGNALGSLKFNLTNSFAIYLHDTNQRELFKKAQRQLSSGCVRIENPVLLAEYLLQDTGYNRNKIESTMAKPGEVVDDQTIVKVPNAMPVYMVYLTSQASRDGVVRFTEDGYQQNLRLSRLGVN